MTTFSSSIRLNKSAVPANKNIAEYKEQLDIHDAIEALAGRLEYITRRLSGITVTADYVPESTYGIIRVDATAGDVDITMPPVAEIQGHEFIVKRIDAVGANTVTLTGDGTEYLDGMALGVTLTPLDVYTIKAHSTGWDII